MKDDEESLFAPQARISLSAPYVECALLARRHLVSLAWPSCWSVVVLEQNGTRHALQMLRG